MTQKPADTQFSIRICGITYEDAVTLCGDKFAAAAKNWCDDDGDSDSEEDGVVEIPVRHIDDLIEILAEIKNADDWAGIHCWDVSLHATRLMPTYSLGASLTDTGCSMIFKPERPAIDAVSEALSSMQSAMVGLRQAACLLEPKQ
jgi:hypothetical protein